MPLSAGQKLGPYELVAAIGEGGMGEVWKARDTRLGRIVAVKVSKGAFSERFEREARAVASLSHPNICTLYDVGPDYLVMEYIEGSPVKGPLPVETALRYAVEIAKALDAAHRLGIVHRDLKPGNILVTKSGIKLLDFGLAKLTNAPAAALGATVTMPLTEEGTILGTLQYMAPEQLEGKEADPRSDIFAFGCVLYEMLTGTSAFSGGSRASIIAAIMAREPKPLAGMPQALASAIHRCLAKDPDDRWQSVRDLAGVLELAAVPATESDAAPVARTPRRLFAALGALTVLASAAAFWLGSRRPQEPVWSGVPLGGPAHAMGPRVSPDGHTIAFEAMVEGQTQVAIMKPESGNWTVLTHQRDLGPVDDIAWARDGSKLYFDRDSGTPAGVFSVPLLGGEPRLVLEAAGLPDVLADGSLIVIRVNAQRNDQLHHYWPESGKLEPLPAVVDQSGTAPRSTPDGKKVIFFGTPLAADGSKGPRGIYVLDLQSRALVNLTPRRQVLTNTGISLAAMPDGRSIVYAEQTHGLNHVSAVSLNGSGEVRQLFTLTGVPVHIDVAPDGSVYADQALWDSMILRFPPTGGVPEELVHLQGGDPTGTLALVLPDGRPLVYSVSGFKKRFQIVQPGGSLSPLIESSEECGLPAALAGEGQVAVLTDRSPLQIAIVSIADGRIVRHVAVKAESIESLASSPEGGMFYYGSSGFIWSMPASGGEPQKLTPGDGVSAGANGRDLFVLLHEKDAFRLVKVPVSGGAPQPIDFHGDAHIPDYAMSASIAGPGGLLAVMTQTPSRWYYQPGLIDPVKGTISRVPVNFDGEILVPAWSRDGKLVASGGLLNASIWRFHAGRARASP